MHSMSKRLGVAMAAALVLGGAGAASAQADWNHQHDRGDHSRDHGRDNGRGYNDRSYNGGGQWRSEWRRGGRMDRNYWSHASRVDWRTRHLRRPPRGYEWREVNGNYVLAAVASGLIADLIINSR